MKALERANEVRVWRAEQARRIRGGDIEHACAVLQSGDSRLADMELGDFLAWLPRYGVSRIRTVVNASFAFPTAWSSKRKIGTIDLMTLLRVNAEVRKAEARCEKRYTQERARRKQRTAEKAVA